MIDKKIGISVLPIVESFSRVREGIINENRDLCDIKKSLIVLEIGPYKVQVLSSAADLDRVRPDSSQL